MEKIDNNKSKQHQKLGFSTLETAIIVADLNKLLAAQQVYAQKLKGFHWNIVGANFFELHDLFEVYYKDAIQSIDDFAERIRVFGKKPVCTMQEILEVSEVKEATVELTSVDMVNHVLQDMSVLISLAMDTLNNAIEQGDAGTVNMMNKHIAALEKKHWQLTAWSKQESFEVWKSQ